MNNFDHLKPIKRSNTRIFLGKAYFKLKRYVSWYVTSKKYVKDVINEPLKYKHFDHSTPLFRKLRNVDMWLQHNKAENLKIAIKKVNGIVIKPGETFSYWKAIGKLTKRKGYKEGMVLHYGSFKPGVGGGISQLSNMIYWMVIHTTLTVTERHRHSFDVFPDSNRSQPFGSGATCVYNYRDLQIKNNTNDMYQLNFKIEGDHLVGEIRYPSQANYSYKVYEKEHKITHEYWGAYIRHNLINRSVIDLDGNIVNDEFVCENHALMMYEPLLACSSNEKYKNVI